MLVHRILALLSQGHAGKTVLGTFKHQLFMFILRKNIFPSLVLAMNVRCQNVYEEINVCVTVLNKATDEAFLLWKPSGAFCQLQPIC